MTSNVAGSRIGQPWRSLLRDALAQASAGNVTAAVDRITAALADNPDNALLHYNLGVLLMQTGEPTKGLTCFRQAATLDPGQPEAWMGWAQAALALGQVDTALNCSRRAVEAAPDNSRAHYNLANLFKNLENYVNAEKHFRRVLELEPRDKASLNNLGVLCLQTGAYEKAGEWFRKALSADPDDIQSLYNLGLTLKRLGSAELALAPVQRCLRLQPDYPQALALHVSLLQQLCDWQGLDEAQARLDAITQQQLARGVCPAESPFLSFSRTPDPLRNLQVAGAWAQGIAAKAAQGGFGHQPVSVSKTKSRIVIGYLSEQFRDAATAHLMAALFEKHDRSRFRIHAYSLGPDDHSAYRRKIIGSVDRFVDVRPLSASAAAGRIHEDHVDILVDLIGWMHGNRVLISALRPAPIQVNYLGYPGTAGAPFFDYILADSIVIPEEHQPFFTEKVVYLPHCYQVTDPQPPVSRSGVTRKQCGLPQDAVVFCSFCTDYKIDRSIFQAWLAILAAVPGSVLWLLVRTQAAADNLRKAARLAGLDPCRLIFASALPKPHHLERLALADLALDTTLVNGHTTTTDALWAGVPVLTLQGRHFASRVASSLIQAMGFKELVKTNLQEYVDFAVHLGLDICQLASLKQRVKRNRQHAALFDIRGFTHGLEAAFRQMWEIHLRGDPPHSFNATPC